METAPQEIIETSTGFLPMFLMLGFTAFIAVVVWLLATYLGPNRPNKEKNSPYECGIVPAESVHQRLDIHFYRVSILFVIFGVEMLFFLPWAVALSNAADRSARLVALGDMFIFTFIIVTGLVFAWAKGGLKWSMDE